MDMKQQAYQIKQLLPLADLEEPLQYAVLNGTLAPKAALQLTQLSFRDRIALFDMIVTLHLSIGNQKKLTSICIELAKRTNQSILSILSDPGIIEILGSEANIPQKAANTMQSSSI